MRFLYMMRSMGLVLEKPGHHICQVAIRRAREHYLWQALFEAIVVCTNNLLVSMTKRKTLESSFSRG